MAELPSLVEVWCAPSVGTPRVPPQARGGLVDPADIGPDHLPVLSARDDIVRIVGARAPRPRRPAPRRGGGPGCAPGPRICPCVSSVFPSVGNAPGVPDGLDLHVVHEAVPPVLTGLERLDDRMS